MRTLTERHTVLFKDAERATVTDLLRENHSVNILSNQRHALPVGKTKHSHAVDYLDTYNATINIVELPPVEPENDFWAWDDGTSMDWDDFTPMET